MKSSALAGLALCSTSFFLACGAVEETAQPDPGVVVETPDPPQKKPPVEEEPQTPAQCTPAVAAPTCASTKPAPTSSTAITKFVKDAAVPIRCGANDKNTWDLRPLIDLYGNNKIFMIGEVHGTNEIGIVSSLVFDELVKKNLVNVVAFEMPMDVEAPLQRWVDTGKDPTADNLLKYMAPNFFGTLLPKSAREAVLKGAKIKVGAVDIPQQPQIAIYAIQEVAAKLTTQKDTVLATLPMSVTGQGSPDEAMQVNAYFDHIIAKKSEICSELSAADCERLVAMTHALWASTLTYDDGGDSELWFARREEVIYYNMKTKIAGPSDRMFLHMGAAHTNKHWFSAGSKMAKEYELTKGLVFSVAPAWGDGSVIWYGQDMPLPADPTTIVDALTDEPPHPTYISMTRPTNDCEANPVGLEPEGRVGHNNDGTRAELYDGYIHYGKLTSERRPYDTSLSRDGSSQGAKAAPQSKALEGLVQFRKRIEAKEHAALAARAERLRRF